MTARTTSQLPTDGALAAEEDSRPEGFCANSLSTSDSGKDKVRERFFERTRPWGDSESDSDSESSSLMPEKSRRRRAGLYWTGIYILLMAGLTSLISFVVVKGYLSIWPDPTSAGVSVAKTVVPWVFTGVFGGLAFFVTRSVWRTAGYLSLFLLPLLVVAFAQGATDVATWLVSWIPGQTQVYGLVSLCPFIGAVLLGRAFVRWQLWVEFPQDQCWECGRLVTDRRWIVCPMCACDLTSRSATVAAT